MAEGVATGRAGLARVVVVSSSVYSLDTVKKASYRFIDRAAPSFAVSEHEITCTFNFAAGVSEATADGLVRDFQAELLDQDLRERIGKETAPLRNTILALAFAPTNPPKDE